MSWTWRKRLSAFPGDLVVRPANFLAHAYFPGPDGRYNGTFWDLKDREISEYVSSLRLAWQRYVQLKSNDLQEGEIVLTMPMGIHVLVRSFPGSGLTLHQRHHLLQVEHQVEALASELLGLQQIAASVQQALSGQTSAPR